MGETIISDDNLFEWDSQKNSDILKLGINNILLFITSLLKFLDISYFSLQLPSALKYPLLHN